MRPLPDIRKTVVLQAGAYGDAPCKVTELEPPHRLGFDWAQDWHLTIELGDLGGKTELTLTHSGWDADKVAGFDQPHEEVRKTMDSGWGRLTDTDLREYIEKR